jgi:Tfp pilus assembly PilM family ATPase
MALCNTFPNADAVIDIGSERFSIHAISRDGALFTVWRAIGGDAVTEGIREDLAVDRTTAESRKRILGTAGAGDNAMQELVGAITESMDVVRRRKRTVECIAIAGNGSRLHGLHDALERSSGLSIAANRLEGLSATIFSNDVARAARTDWALAVGLACWGSRT